MKNKELIELITELKQQLDESRDTDFDNYVGKLSKRASKSISELKVNNVVSDDAIKCDCKLESHERAKMELDYNKCMDCKKDIN
tara:strand:- start:2352 stop:2603 length:252 start_codon:yes stop_codon:yes gene_type:complete